MSLLFFLKKKIRFLIQGFIEGRLNYSGLNIGSNIQNTINELKSKKKIKNVKINLQILTSHVYCIKKQNVLVYQKKIKNLSHF